MLGVLGASAGGIVLAPGVFFLCVSAFSIPHQLLLSRLRWTGDPEEVSSWLPEWRGQWCWEAFGGIKDLFGESV